jgi:F-type H+-transporting ATPase subunit a
VHEQIGDHVIWRLPVHLGPFSTIHGDTIVMTWGVMLVSLAFFWWMGATYRGAKVSKRHLVLEGVINYLADLAYGVLGPQAERFVPFFVCLFIYIFLLNQVGFLPLKLLGVSYGGSPTADLSTTFAYAILVFVMIQVVAVRKYGLKFYLHFFKPYPILAPINIIEELARPITLSLRLFFNIFVGEILLYVISSIIISGVRIGGFDLSLAAAFVPIFIQFLNFFIGTIQAFVFTLLTIVYLSMAVGEEH